MLVVLILLQPSKADGSGVTWGRIDCGGDSSSVASLLQDGVVQVTGSSVAFAAIKADRSVVSYCRVLPALSLERVISSTFSLSTIHCSFVTSLVLLLFYPVCCGS